jgi:hypothetical protein
MNMKLNYWYHLTKSAENSWLRAAYSECFKIGQEPQTTRGWNSSFAKEIHDFKSKLEIPDPATSKSKNIFKTTVKRKTKSHFSKLDKASIEEQRAHSLRAYPIYKNQGKPQEYLLCTKNSSVLTSFRLGDAGLGNRSANPIRICPMCRTGSNSEAHLVFQCTSVSNIRSVWNFPNVASPQDDAGAMLQDFLNFKGVSTTEIKQRAEFLETLVEYHNSYLDNLNINQATQEPLITLSEKCNLCEFSSHTRRGVNIHKGLKHKNQL